MQQQPEISGDRSPPLSDDDRNRVFTINFGSLGNGADYKVRGWQDAERGFTWTQGTQSSLAFPRPEHPGRHALELQVVPFIWKTVLPAQRIRIAVNEHPLGSFSVEHDAVLTCDVPWTTLAGHAVCVVEFSLPDAAKPEEVNGVPDLRSLALAFEEVRLIRLEGEILEEEGHGETPPNIAGKHFAAVDAGDGLKKLMMRFESLGEDCEFGLVQRRCGAEPLGLLRFSSTPLPKLIAALDARFQGLGLPDSIKVELSSNGREYMVLDQRFGLYYHAWVLAGEKTPAEIHARECSRLPFLVRKLIEDLKGGEKIFVYRGMTPLAEPDVSRLAASMRAYGANTLLWVEVAQPGEEAGSVEEIAPGLLKGKIERFAPASNAHDFSLEAWREICSNANALTG